MRRWFLAIAMLTFGSACAHPVTGTKTSTDRSVIARDEMDRGHYATVYDAVSALRRNWLQPRGADSFNNPSQVKVYLDNIMLGGTETLKNLVPMSVTSIKYYDGIAATTRWGIDHGAGAIVVSSSAARSNP